MISPLRTYILTVGFVLNVVSAVYGNITSPSNAIPASGPIGRAFTILEDEVDSLTPEQAFNSEHFVNSTQDVPNLGCSGSTFWLRSTLPHDIHAQRSVLQIPHAEIDELDLYYLKDGALVHWMHKGQTRRSSDLFPPGRTFEIEIPRGLNADLDLLIRVKSKKQLQVPIFLRSPAAASIQQIKLNSFAGLYIGMMLVLALYNIFIFLSTKDGSYLRYVIYILLVTFTQLAFYGIAPVSIWPNNAFLLDRSSLFLTIFTAVAATEFIKRFIGTKEFTPRLHKGIRLFYGAFLLSIILYFTPHAWMGYQVAQAVSGIYAFYVLAIIITIWRKGSRAGGFVLVAWSVFLIGTVVFVMKDAGILPYNDLTLMMMPLGSAIEGVLLSLALADRINILRREKDQSQAESLRISKENERIIREQNVLLEEKVKQRTHALEESHEHLKRTQTQLVNAEKMASLGQLTAGIAHEINNPINFITSNIQPLRRNISDIVELMKDYRQLEPSTASDRLPGIKKKDVDLGIQESIEELDDIINSIAEGSSRTAEIVRGLRNFSRLDESDLKDSDLNEGIRNTVTVLAPQFRDKVRMVMNCGDIPKVECFPGKVNQVFMNILTNAVQATIAKPGDHDRMVTISSTSTEDHVIISIVDNGIGMSEEVKAKIFDPFFTTKAVGEGTGLGMAIVYGIIEDHHGSIQVYSTPGEGTEFKVTLPIRHMRLNERRA